MGFARDDTIDLPETINVTVRDRSSETPWGSGPNNPVTRKITISENCRVCGGPRGERRGLNTHDDGCWYWVEVWENPCGHLDFYEDAVKEARELAARHKELAGTGRDSEGGKLMGSPLWKMFCENGHLIWRYDESPRKLGETLWCSGCEGDATIASCEPFIETYGCGS